MPVSLDLARHRLLSSHEALVENWESTRHVWQDQVGAAFAKERLEPVAPLDVDQGRWAYPATPFQKPPDTVDDAVRAPATPAGSLEALVSARTCHA